METKNEREDTDKAVSSSEAVAFVEFEEAKGCISTIISNDTSYLKEKDDALVELRKVYDKYLEMPSLMDRHLEFMVDTLAGSARLLMDDDNLDFWESPLPRILSALYALSKVRGRKRVQKFLPHQVKDVEVVLRTLVRLDNEMSKNLGISEDGTPQLWESIHTLWNWMGILGLVPFNSSVLMDETRISELIELGKAHLSHAGPTRVMAAACLASWLSRPEFEDSRLQDFYAWSREFIIEYEAGKRDIYLTMGILQTVVTILKVSTADREILISTAKQVWPVALRISEARPSNILLRKYLVKFWTRLGTIYMPPRVVAWRYRLGRRSLKENLTQVSQPQSLDSEEAKDVTEDDFFLVPDQVEEAVGQVISALTDASTAVRWSAAKGVGRITSRLPAICAEDIVDSLLELFDDIEKDNNWHGACLAFAELARRGLLLPGQLPLVVPRLVEAIHYDVPRRQTSVGANVRDAACYTYWAIARAYSPAVLKPFVSRISESVILAFLYDREVNCRRAASAAFQELVGRQGANNFKHGISILTSADYFSLGNRVDAYRSISKSVARFDEYRKAMINHLFRIKLRHWDPNIRSLTAEAISDLTSYEVEYIESTVIPYLLEKSLDPRDFQLRHGAVRGLAETILAFGMDSQNGANDLSKESVDAIADIVPAIEKKRLYRGKGGELMRAAVCRLIECISRTRIPLTVPQQVRLLDTVDACLPHPSEAIQEQAGKALFHLMRAYFPVGPKGPSDRLQKRVVSKYAKEVRTSANPAATRGFALALGNLPAKLLAPTSSVLDISLACLCRASRPDAQVGGERDAETRRNSLVALASICKTVGVLPSPEETERLVGITKVQASHICTALLRGLNDYNMERRGDVGSMSRVVAMHGLVTFASVMVSADHVDHEFFNKDTCVKLVGGLLKQLCEKLDLVRSQAGSCLQDVLTRSSPSIPYIPSRDRLFQIFLERSDKEHHGVNWADASATFPLVIKCLEIDGLFHYIISGLVISVGSLTQSVTKPASAALLEWVKGAPPSQVFRLGEAFLRIFKDHQHDGRVILPLLKTIEILMNRVSIDSLIQDDSFSSQLFFLLQEEMKRSNDINRLTALVTVTMGLVTDCQSRKEPLALACKMLMHSFPRIRRFTAESLYVKLLEDAGLSDQDIVVGLLLESLWDADHSVDTVKDMSMAVASALGVATLLSTPESTSAAPAAS